MYVFNEDTYACKVIKNALKLMLNINFMFRFKQVIDMNVRYHKVTSCTKLTSQLQSASV